MSSLAPGSPAHCRYSTDAPSLNEGIPRTVIGSNPSATSSSLDLSPSLGIRVSPRELTHQFLQVKGAQQAWHTVGVLLNKALSTGCCWWCLPPAAPPGQQGNCPARPGVPAQPQQGAGFPTGPGRSLLCSVKRNQPGLTLRSQAAPAFLQPLCYAPAGHPEVVQGRAGAEASDTGASASPLSAFK